MTTDANTSFVLFGTDHLVAMLIITVAAVTIPFLIDRVELEERKHLLATVLGALLVAHEVLKFLLRVYVDGERLVNHLPLHLCSAGAFLLAYVLIRRSYGAFEVAYFWGFGGTLQAIITPDVASAFPSRLFVLFFLGHGLVVLGLVTALVVYRFRPTLASLGKTIRVTLAYTAGVAVVNSLLGTNYLYLSHKPAQASVLDLLGPWPWYIAPLIGLGLLVCCIVYLPVAFLNWRAQRATP